MSCFCCNNNETKYTYIIPGRPTALMRPRFNPRGHVWDAQKHLKEEAAQLVKAQHGSKQSLKGPLHLNIAFYMYISSSKSKKEKELLRYMPHIARPDLSNMIKFVEDICIDVVYADDSIITSIYANKLYDEEPRTEFSFMQIKETEDGK